MNAVILLSTLLIVYFKFAKSAISNEGSGNSEYDDESIWSNVDDKIIEAFNITREEILSSYSTCNASLSQITEIQREIILTTHNELRRSLAFGRQRNKRGFMNSARNMYKLDWDCELEEMAANWSLTCPNAFMPQNMLGSNAQLFKQFWFYFDGHDSLTHIKSAMKSWWKQGQDHGNLDPKNRFYAKNNYFGWANMAKGKTFRIGCAYSKCPNNISAMFVCLYNEKAQCEREMIYENGKPCCNDSDCFTYPCSKCLLPEGLCQAPYIPEDPGNSTWCNNSQMTDLTRKWTLEQHNFYRSRLARGLEWNGETNSTQPKARNMLKLAVEKWWQELEEFGTPPHNVLTSELWEQKGRDIGHYTQMAWAKTYRVGCGIADCPHMSYVVCHYGPAGNRKNNRIYDYGEPCRSDADCPGKTLCDLTTSLCMISK
ncbi:unnamed protein product [Caenorhabditis bovis]|uniref:SCP domain-containing protein n=1 Tax=Caenorhabditis bovis TaxID=2654633 RepID=A0A8S1EI73_9PELO|nr:unnamed protein product [Caenorhabditis bovis]